jgi:hypothetical protein
MSTITIYVGYAVASDGQLLGWSRKGRCRLIGQTSRQRKCLKQNKTQFIKKKKHTMTTTTKLNDVTKISFGLLDLNLSL